MSVEIHGKHREPDPRALVSAPGQLAQPSPRSPWSPQLQQVQTQGAEGPGETRSSEQGVLETPAAPSLADLQESDVTVNKAFNQLTWAPKWLGLASPAEAAGSWALYCAERSPEAIYLTTTSPEHRPSRPISGLLQCWAPGLCNFNCLLIGPEINNE